MKKIIRYIKNLFKQKPKPKIPISSDITQGDCPICNSEGTLIYYASKHITVYESFYRCGNCLTKIDNDKYLMTQRKQKLQKIYEQSSDFTKK